jgi:hypothetical protein
VAFSSGHDVSMEHHRLLHVFYGQGTAIAAAAHNGLTRSTSLQQMTAVRIYTEKALLSKASVYT